ncbi:hypothetical protein ABZ671_18830 [Micromonospora sp. NPDC006766]|uniref:hypothetical protein n=1 Tax=Micromonospora sp. NPDC006766 TaxID=3154778 RepID=UPI0033C24E61
MSYPPNLAPVTVTGRYTLADQGGTPAPGTVAFQLRDRVQLPTDDLILIPTRVEVELIDGALPSVELPSLAAADGNPDGVTWWVVERINGETRTYDIHLPPGPATVDLADLAPAEPSRGLVSYVLAGQVGQPGGVAPLGPDGLVPAEHLPEGNGGGGPGAVTSVDGRTGAVDLSDRYVPLASRGQPGGVATLDGGGKLPSAQLPAITASQVGAAPASHTHDDRYYTESEIDVALAGRAPANHSHPYVPAGAVGAPDGVASLDGGGKLPKGQLPAITAADVGASPIGHNHDGRYPTGAEVADALAGKAEDVHAHPEYVTTAAIGAEGGPAGPLVGGVLPTSQLPALAITDVFTVGSAAEMQALPAQQGDVAIRTDLPGACILAAEPATALSNWKVLPTPADAVLSVNGSIGVVVLGAADVGAATADHTHTPASIGAAPAAHTHTPAEAGAAPAVHTHTAADISSGTLAAARLPDATTGAKGVVQLAGDLAGTAAAPTVPGLTARPTVMLWDVDTYRPVTGARVYLGGPADPTTNPGDVWIKGATP